MKAVKNSFALQRWVRTAGPAKPSVEFGSKEKLLLWTLASHVDPTKTGPLSWQTGVANLVQESLLSDASVKRAIRNLEKRGLIRVNRLKLNDDDNQPNIYTLLIPADWEQDYKDSPPRITETPGVGSDRTQGWAHTEPTTGVIQTPIRSPKKTNEDNMNGGGGSPTTYSHTNLTGPCKKSDGGNAPAEWSPDETQRRLSQIYSIDRSWTLKEQEAYATGLAGLNGQAPSDADLNLLGAWVRAKPAAQLDYFAATLERLHGQLERAAKWEAREKAKAQPTPAPAAKGTAAPFKTTAPESTLEEVLKDVETESAGECNWTADSHASTKSGSGTEKVAAMDSAGEPRRSNQSISPEKRRKFLRHCLGPLTPPALPDTLKGEAREEAKRALQEIRAKIQKTLPLPDKSLLVRGLSLGEMKHVASVHVLRGGSGALKVMTSHQLIERYLGKNKEEDGQAFSDTPEPKWVIIHQRNQVVNKLYADVICQILTTRWLSKKMTIVLLEEDLPQVVEWFKGRGEFVWGKKE